MTPGESNKKELEIPSFCFSCGLTDPSVPTCECSAPVQAPSWTPSLIGSVLRVKSPFSTKTGVVLSEGEKSSLILSEGKTIEVGSSRLRKGESVVDMTMVPSELFRLHSIAERDEEWARGVRAWLANSERTEEFLPDWDSKRLFARSAIAAGQPDVAGKSGLSAEEITWLQMHAAHSSGDATRATALAVQLPPDRYPDKVLVAISGLVEHSWMPSQSELESLDRWPPSMNGVNAVRAAVGLEIPLEDWATLLDSIPDSGHFDQRWIELMLTGRYGQNLSDRDRECAQEVAANAASSDLGREFTLAERMIASRFGMQLTLSGDEAIRAADRALETLDDLIDANRVTFDGDAQEVPPRLLARLAPASLSDEALQDLDHSWERARRVFQADGKGEWPNGPAGDHYRALSGLKRGDTRSISAIQDLAGTAQAVANSLNSRTLHPLVLDDPTTWDTLEELIPTEGLDVQSEDAASWSLAKALEAVFAWDWDRASTHARMALRGSGDEALRDEALNIIGFVRYQKGEDEEALTALERALDGEYTASLQANAGIVAEHLAPDRAAIHLGKLASEAPNEELKLAAVRHAIRIWGSSRPAWEGDDDSMSVPAELSEALRQLCVADIAVDDFGEVMRLLSNFDADWLALESNTEDSPHRDSWERQVFVAKAGGDPADYIEAVASGLKSGYEADWLAQERDGMVDGLRALIFEDIEHLGPATYAFIAIDKGLPMQTWDRVVLTCGSMVSICRSLISEESMPSDQLIEMFEDAERALPELSEEQREIVQTLVDAAGNSLAQTIGVSCESNLNQGFQALSTLTAQLYGVPRRNINWQKVAEALRPIRGMANETSRYLDKAQSYAADQELGEALRSTSERARELRGFAENPRSVFR